MLVATTVIEVGVDVPNATGMVILDAERFGLSQLHQLRGRVGRGSAAGVCLLVTEMPAATAARTRLDAIADTTDGFALAQLDLELRREGDVLGALQSGRRSGLRLLSLLNHEEIIAKARVYAMDIVEHDPTLAAHGGLAALVGPDRRRRGARGLARPGLNRLGSARRAARPQPRWAPPWAWPRRVLRRGGRGQAGSAPRAAASRAAVAGSGTWMTPARSSLASSERARA